MSMYRVLVFGGRTFSNRDLLWKKLHEFYAKYTIQLIITGGATGADTLAHEWATSQLIPAKVFPADWDNIEAPGAVVREGSRGRLYNVNAGFERNIRMLVEGKPHVGIKFPGGNGTVHMARELKSAGVPVWNAVTPLTSFRGL